MNEDLVVLADGQVMGQVSRKGQRLTFEYDPAWLAFPGAFPLSTSMPMVVAEHGHAVVEAFLWGLLPDNDAVLTRWGQRFGVSPRNPFKLIAHVGEDVAGALQFVRPDRVAALADVPDGPVVTWLDDGALDERIRLLLADASAGRRAGDHGQFSLAGAQPKTALYRDPDSGRWGIPEGRTPTTHILKPATGAFDGFAVNEHFCLCLAASLGLPAVESQVIRCDQSMVIVTERYDRVTINGWPHRRHQEDFCQALAVPPQKKYQNQGGPSAKAIGAVLWDLSVKPMDDVWCFAESLALNWLIGGTDGHAKNYSLLLGPSGDVRLAPLYDIASSLPYPDHIVPEKATLAIRVGRDYRVRDIKRSNWESCARELRLGPGDMIERIHGLIDRLPGHAAQCAGALSEEGLDDPIVHRLVDAISGHANRCRDALAG